MALWRNANSGATAPKREGVFFTMKGSFVVVRHGEQLHFPHSVSDSDENLSFLREDKTYFRD